MAIVIQTGYLVVGFLLGSYLVYKWLFSSPLPANIPRVRDTGKSRFSFSTRMAYYTSCEKLFQEAYEKFSKNGRTCVIPGLGFRNEVILPPQSYKWIASQPEHILSVYEAFAEVDQAAYTAGNEDFVLNPWQGLLIKRNMNRVLERLMAAMHDELTFAFAERLPQNSKDWTTINVYDSLRRIIAQGTSRFTVGLPLCRNEHYITASINYSDMFVINAGVIGALPKAMRPILGPVLSLPSRYYEGQARKDLKPTFEERIARLDNDDRNDDHDDEEDDLLQMMLRYARSKSPSDFNLHRIAGRVCISNFGSMHQASLAITNIVLNILESDKEYNTISEIRKEIQEVLSANNDVWSRQTVARMLKVDSILRESMRLYSFGNRALIRKVVAPEGIKGEDGVVIPRGNLVSILAAPIQQDPHNFSDPHRFDPFRFSRVREAAKAATPTTEGFVLGSHDNGDMGLKFSNGDASTLAFVSTGQTFLPFGHGKHACPGRYIADFELKMMVAQLVTEYDIEFPPEYNGIRPKSIWMAEAILPPMGAKIRIKKRER